MYQLIAVDLLTILFFSPICIRNCTIIIVIFADAAVNNVNNNSYHGNSRLAEPEYIQELKALQHKIMTLQDSNDLQQGEFDCSKVWGSQEAEINIKTNLFFSSICSGGDNSGDRTV